MKILGYHKTSPFACTPLIPIFVSEDNINALHLAIADEYGKIQHFKRCTSIDANSLISIPSQSNIEFDLGSEHIVGYQYNEDQLTFGNKEKIAKNLANALKLKNIHGQPFLSLEIAIEMSDENLIKKQTIQCWKILVAIDEDFAKIWLHSANIPAIYRSEIISEIGKDKSLIQTSLPLSGPFFLMKFLSKASTELGYSSRVELIRSALLSFVQNENFFRDEIIKKIDRFSSEIHNYVNTIEHALHAVAYRNIQQTIMVDAAIVGDRNSFRKTLEKRESQSADLLVKSSIDEQLNKLPDAIMLISLVHTLSKLKGEMDVAKFCTDEIKAAILSEVGGQRT